MNPDYEASLLYLGKRLKSFTVKQTDDGYVFTVRRSYFVAMFIYLTEGVEVQILPTKGGMRIKEFWHENLSQAHKYFCDECKRALTEEAGKAPPDADKNFNHAKFAE